MLLLESYISRRYCICYKTTLAAESWIYTHVIRPQSETCEQQYILEFAYYDRFADAGGMSKAEAITCIVEGITVAWDPVSSYQDRRTTCTIEMLCLSWTCWFSTDLLHYACDKLSKHSIDWNILTQAQWWKLPSTKTSHNCDNVDSTEQTCKNTS